jgi:putative peptidoglycan lipid II flippase
MVMAMTATSDHNQRVLNNRQIQRATGIIAAAYILSGVLGVVRQAIIGGQFGAGLELDAFNAALRIPETLFALVAGGALGSAFIPIFSRFLGQEDTDGAWRLANAVMSLVGIAGIVLALVAGIFGDWIVVHILSPQAPPAEQALTTELMRIMLCTVAIFGISGLVMGILNTYQHFLTPALAPSMYNIGLIIGAILFAPTFGVQGLAAGAVLGALLHLGIQLPALRNVKPRLRFLPDFRTPGVREVLVLMGPRVVGQAVVQVNFVVNVALSSGMAAGSLTALTYAFGLMFTVLGVLGQSIGTAVFPTLSALAAEGDTDGYRQALSGALRNVLFLSIPASVGMIVLAVPMIATILQHGQWTADDTLATAWALRFFSLGLVAFALQEVLARAFYALRDTATPVLIGIGGMILNVILSLLLIRIVRGQNPVEGPFGGLALANALATMIESLALWLVLRRRLSGLDDKRILNMAGRTLIASLVMGLVVWLVAGLLNALPAVIVLVVGAVIGLIVFEIAALALGLAEARTIPGIVLRRFQR